VVLRVGLEDAKLDRRVLFIVVKGEITWEPVTVAPSISNRKI
jgi:hypothetical protein